MAASIFSPSDLKHALFNDPHTHLIIFEEDYNQSYYRGESILMKYVRPGSLEEQILIYDTKKNKYTTPDRAAKFNTVNELISWYLKEMGLISHKGTIILINTLHSPSDAWDNIPNGLFHVNPPR